AACNELDHQTYADPAVAARLDDYVNVKLDFTRTSETTKALTEEYQIPGLPVVIFLDADRTTLKRFTGFVNAEDMLGILDEIESSRQ
ncbi:MAG: thioredoxin fold domain-containing protein, partial [Candidatus Poribacteria bacterium]|nr:thioredoxin fold domain-containing protein [Candidatus Poribacteria bacterium]